MAKRKPARRRKRVGAQSIGLAPADTADIQGAGVRELADRIKQDGGAVLGSYREPFGGTPAVLATLPIDRVEPTPYQRVPRRRTGSAS
jgi:ParB family chromosome partitioning protein